MAAYNVNSRCEDCTFSYEYGRMCQHGLMYPLMVIFCYGDMYQCPNFKNKTAEQIERQIKLRERNIDDLK